MKAQTNIAIAVVLGIAVSLSGCAGIKTFSSSARAGDTVALSLGWTQALERQAIRVDISGAGAANYTYPPGDPSVRLAANFYPDPGSRLIVGRETGQSLGVNAAVTGENLETLVTGGGKEYAQGMVFINLPATLPVGVASIQVFDATSGDQIGATTTVEVLPGTGAPHTFQGIGGPASSEMLASLERAENKQVTFDGVAVPYGIQLDLTYTGGKPWLVNPRGDLTSMAWSDTGSRIRVMLLPTNQLAPSNLSLFRFYVAGGVNGLAVDAASVRAFDANGNAISGLSVLIN